MPRPVKPPVDTKRTINWSLRSPSGTLLILPRWWFRKFRERRTAQANINSRKSGKTSRWVANLWSLVPEPLLHVNSRLPYGLIIQLKFSVCVCLWDWLYRVGVCTDEGVCEAVCAQVNCMSVWLCVWKLLYLASRRNGNEGKSRSG